MQLRLPGAHRLAVCRASWPLRPSPCGWAAALPSPSITWALVTVPIAFLLASSYIQTVVLLTISALFTAGMHSGYAIYFPEMFPTRLRATGASFCFNLGRLGSAVLLLCRGEIRGYFERLWPGRACDTQSRPCPCCSSSA